MKKAIFALLLTALYGWGADNTEDVDSNDIKYQPLTLYAGDAGTIQVPFFNDGEARVVDATETAYFWWSTNALDSASIYTLTAEGSNTFSYGSSFFPTNSPTISKWMWGAGIGNKGYGHGDLFVLKNPWYTASNIGITSNILDFARFDGYLNVGDFPMIGSDTIIVTNNGTHIYLDFAPSSDTTTKAYVDAGDLATGTASSNYTDTVVSAEAVLRVAGDVANSNDVTAKVALLVPYTGADKVVTIDPANARTNTFGGLLTILGSSVKEGVFTTASGEAGHAEGSYTTASGNYSHAEGYGTAASGAVSHASGQNASAIHDNTFVWSDGTTIYSDAVKQFTVYATGGIRLHGAPTEGVTPTADVHFATKGYTDTADTTTGTASSNYTDTVVSAEAVLRVAGDLGISNYVDSVLGTETASRIAGDLAGTNYTDTSIATLTGLIPSLEEDILALKELNYGDKNITISSTNDFTFAVGIISAYTGSDTEIVVPYVIGGVDVVNIGNSVFATNTSITSVILPLSVTNITQAAFSGCTGLINLVADGVVYVGQGGLRETGLVALSLPALVDVHPSYVFADNAYLLSLTVGCDCTANMKSTVLGSIFDGTGGVTVYVTDPQASNWDATLDGRPVVRAQLYTGMVTINNTATNASDGVRKDYVDTADALLVPYTGADKVVTIDPANARTNTFGGLLTILGDSVQEGTYTTASGNFSHAEGYETTASGDAGHAEGGDTTASGGYSHAEGSFTTASGDYGHAEGDTTTASGYASHAGGENANAIHDNTHVWSDGTTVASTAEKQYTVYATGGIRLLGGPLEVDGVATLNSNLVVTGTTTGITATMVAQTNATLGATTQDALNALNIWTDNGDGTISRDSDVTVSSNLYAKTVSVGTNAVEAGYVLDVAGDAKVRGDLTVTAGALVANTKQLIVTNATNGEVFSVDEGGDTVIGGADSAAYKLDIRGSKSIIRPDLTWSSGDSAEFQLGDTTTFFGIDFGSLARFQSFRGVELAGFDGVIATFERLGNVGIGTTDPAAKLAVNGAVALYPMATAPTANAGYAQFYGTTNGSGSATMSLINGAGNVTLLGCIDPVTGHEVIPTYNNWTGEGVTRDIDALIDAVEKITIAMPELDIDMDKIRWSTTNPRKDWTIEESKKVAKRDADILSWQSDTNAVKGISPVAYIAKPKPAIVKDWEARMIAKKPILGAK